MLRSWIKQCIPFVKKLIVPSFCVYCRTYGDTSWCSSCASLIKPILATKLVLDGSYASEVHAVTAYEDPVKTLVIAKGWSDYAASIQLGRLMWHYSALQRIPFDYLVPVPLHWTRYAYRGYNQAEVMAQEISRLSGKPISSCLRRVRRTASQATLSLYKRSSNLQNAFSYASTGSDLRGKVIVLLDDVMTTGSTLQAAGKALLEARPEKIYIVVACRVV